MAEDTIQLIFEEDPDSSPIMQHMRGYSDRDFEKYVINEASDGARRALVYEKIELQTLIEKLAGGSKNVQARGIDLRSKIVRERDARRAFSGREFSGNPSILAESGFSGRGRNRGYHSGYSGAELGDIIQIIATLGGAAGLGAATIKGIKDVVLKMLDGRTKRKLTIKVGSTTLQIEGKASKEDVDRLVTQLEQLAKVMKPTGDAKEKAEKSKVAANPSPKNQRAQTKPKTKPRKKQQPAGKLS